jgi:large subunit ribosomal protein L10
MAKQYKVDAVSELTAKLNENKNIILTNYSGVKVSELTTLRSQLKEKGAKYQVVKNNLFKLALKDAGYEQIDEHLKGPIAVAFAGEQVGDVAKLFKGFKKEQDKFDYFLGVIDGVVYDEAGVKKIADLPSKEVLLSQILSLVNGPATNVAMGVNQIMTSLARGIKAVAEKNESA